MKFIALFCIGMGQSLLAVAGQSATLSPEYACFNHKGRHYSDVLRCYRDAHKKQALNYSTLAIEKNDAIEKRSYELTSQTWGTAEAVTPGKWSHRVDIYIPDNAYSNRATLMVNNGINNGDDKNPAKEATDYSDKTLRAIALRTRTITLSVSNVPNQYLTYQGDPIPKREDDSVAYSWKLFLNSPATEVFSSLHIPMMEAVVKTMDLAEAELKPFNIHRFIVSGTSKRAWTAWHTAIADKRVDAIVPFVIDILNTKKVLEHEFDTFGKAWPLAFTPYVRAGITSQLNTPEFDQLMQIEDPLRYINSAYADRLAIPKYIVNASGDSFFTPDNPKFYFDQLPGVKMLRMVPNSDHYGIGQFTESALVPFVNRLQKSVPFPVVTSSTVTSDNKHTLRLLFSEMPVEVVQWAAVNPDARDFRYSCDVRYMSSGVVNLNETGAGAIEAEITFPERGWMASFIEARFKDGLILTSPVQITPEEKYPAEPKPDKGMYCKTIYSYLRVVANA